MKRNKQVRQSAMVSAALMAVLFLLPLAVIVPFREELAAREERVDESGDEPAHPGETDSGVLLRVLDGERVTEMTLGEYLLGVVRAEMPASFEPEALKARLRPPGPTRFINCLPAGTTGIPPISARITPAVRPIRTRRPPGGTGETGRKNMRRKLLPLSGPRTVS